MGRLQDKVVIVTGAAVGLGAGIARRLGEEGANVVITDLDVGNGEASAAETGGLFVRHDVTDEAGWSALVEQVVSRFGRIDGLVNNAGISTARGPMDPEGALVDDWRRLYSVNVESVFLGCKHVIGAMARGGSGGSIVNMASIGSLVPTPFLTAYGASKAAVQHFTRSLALHCCERGHAVRCNSLHPGQVRTPMHDALMARTAADNGITLDQAAEAFLAKVPMKRWQEPVDIANAALFLLSDEARFITGTAIVVDGGMTLTN